MEAPRKGQTNLNPAGEDVTHLGLVYRISVTYLRGDCFNPVRVSNSRVLRFAPVPPSCGASNTIPYMQPAVVLSCGV